MDVLKVDATPDRRGLVVTCPVPVFSAFSSEAISGLERIGNTKRFKADNIPGNCYKIIQFSTKHSVNIMAGEWFYAAAQDGEPRASYEPYDKNKKYSPPRITGETFEPWNHQAYGVRRGLSTEAFGAFWDMGAGKSRLVVDMVQNLGPGISLIVCPVAVLQVWPREFSKHLHSLSKHITIVSLVKGTAKGKGADIMRAVSARRKDEHLVFVINYESVWRPGIAEVFRKIKLDMIACDEAHKIKGHDSKCSKYIGAIGKNASKRLALTGTPMPSTPLDIFGIFRFLDNSIFGHSFTNFRNTYAIMQTVDVRGNNGRIREVQIVRDFKNLDDLRSKVNTISMSIQTSEIVDLPGENHECILVDLKPQTMKYYKALKEELVAEMEDGGIIEAANALVLGLRLQQVECGSVKKIIQIPNPPFEKHVTEQIGREKVSAVAELVDNISRDEPIVVFCRFSADLNALREVVEKAGREYLELSGRANQWVEFQERKDGCVIGVQIQAGGAGVDLTRARYCIYFSIGHSLGDYEQSLKRVYRPGQTKKVYYYHIVARNTIGQQIYDALRNKNNVVSIIGNYLGVKVKGGAISDNGKFVGGVKKS